jgi:hypothetical protein
MVRSCASRQNKSKQIVHQQNQPPRIQAAATSTKRSIVRSTYYEMLGRIFLAVQSCEQNSSLAAALQKAGFGKDELARGKKLAERGQELIDRKAEEAFEDRIYEHNMHSSAAEVEMWQSTVSFLLKKAVEDPTLVARTLGTNLHAHDHNITVVAQSLRTLGMLRTEPRVYEQIGSEQQVHDLLTRGWALLGKVFRNGRIIMSPSSAGHAEHPVFAEIAEQRADMVKWLSAFGAACAMLDGAPAQLGELGYVPEGIGLALGGTSFGVPLHLRAQREELPELDNLRPDPGWSAGRQGRNNENLGQGFVEPTFE